MKTFTQFLEQRDPELYEQILEIYDTRQESVGARISNIGVQIEFASKDTIEKKRKVLENYKQLLKELADEDKRKYRTQLVSYARAIEDMLKSDSQIDYDPRINKETIQGRGDKLDSRHFVAPPKTKTSRVPTTNILPTRKLQHTV